MTMSKSKSERGIPKTEVFGMRLDPKMKYLAEIGARKQRRSLGNFVEWAIEKALERVYLVEPEEGNKNKGKTVDELSLDLWDLEESDRLIRLARMIPELMTYSEQSIWRVIVGYSIKHPTDPSISLCFMDVTEQAETVILDDAVRYCWPEIKAFSTSRDAKKALDEIILQYHNETV